jgi:hypothetical protein
MIGYLKTYYSEDFNDFIESSEYVALIDCIAFMGQALAFRTDLNARENFIDTAERRDSILKLARLVSYNPKRSNPASGFLKVTSISTSESLTDSTGNNLKNTVIYWNDVANSNWSEQFSILFNAALVNSQLIGKPGNSQIINGINNQEYSINTMPNNVAVFPFNAAIEGSNINFEVVSATSVSQPYIYEVPPAPRSKFNILFRNDNQGNDSVNTGFFLYFKQGSLQHTDFNITDAIPNRVLTVSYNNINNSDVWLYDLTTQMSENNLWTQVPAVGGVNVIYNNLVDRNLYQVNSLAGDQVDYVFGDGSFANIPQGNFRTYFRTGNALSYKVTPDEMQNITISVNYISRSGNTETLVIRAALNYTVSNATASESLVSIRQNAPQQYYTQSRMITGEDYNIFPLTTFNDILKVKALNRTSSGISRYLDISDTSGLYSSTNIFAEDGYLYLDNTLKSLNFTYVTTANVQQMIQNDLIKILNTPELLQFYYRYGVRYARRYDIFSDITTQMPWLSAGQETSIRSFPILWNQCTTISNGSTGLFYFSYLLNANTPYLNTNKDKGIELGYGASGGGQVQSNIGQFVHPNAIIKFAAGMGSTGNRYCFNSKNQIAKRTPSRPGDRLYIYATIISIDGYGSSTNAVTGAGPVTLNQIVPSDAVMLEILPAFSNNIPTLGATNNIPNYIPASTFNMTQYVLHNNSFGLRFDSPNQTWVIVNAADLNTTSSFSLTNAGNTSQTQLDSSWLIWFSYNVGTGYAIYWRSLLYIFGSQLETTFYFDDNVKVFDSTTGTTIIDSVNVLKVNSDPITAHPLGIDVTFNIYSSIVDVDGYQDQSNIYVTYTDSNNDGIPDNPDIFNMVVNSNLSDISRSNNFMLSNLQSEQPLISLVFFKQNNSYDSFNSYSLLDSNAIAPVSSLFLTNAKSTSDMYPYIVGQIFYVYDNDPTIDVTNQVFFKWDGNFTALKQPNLVKLLGYVAKIGRQDLYFQYRHNSPNYRRIDPSPSNLIDVYLLTQAYAIDYKNWIQDSTNTLSEPISPSVDQLSQSYGTLNNFKAISDALIFSSAVFKPLFGNKASTSLQATFMVVKNPLINISDNDVKANVINAINAYFAVSNWDFGDTFYFSELSAYLHTILSPNISSIILVPNDPTASFGSLYQVNAEANEIFTSAATVNNVKIISALTAASINSNVGQTANNLVVGKIV